MSPKPWWKCYGLVLGIYAVLMAVCRPYYVGDSIEVYVGQALSYARAEMPITGLLEFGHILIRPLAFGIYKWAWPLKPNWIDLDERLFVAVGLITVSMLAGAVFAILMQKIATKISGSEAVGRGVAVVLVASNAFLNYAQTGCAYVPGLTLLTGAVYCAVMEVRSTRRVALAAFCLAASILFWFPYVLLYPAVFLLLWRWSGFRRAAEVAVCTGLFLGAAYGLVLVIAQLHTLQDILAWYQFSKHLLHPTPSLPRLIYSIARTFLNMGDQGVILKRFLLHDPYAHVSVWQLLGLGLMKTFLFYVAGAGLLAAYWYRRGSVILWTLLAAILPVAYFAMFLFEASSPERYIGFLPFVGIAAAAVFAQANAGKGLILTVARGGILLFATLATVLNVIAMSRPVIGAEEIATGQRVEALRQHFRPGSEIALLKYSDEIFLFNLNFPFNPLNRDRPTRFFEVVEIGSDRMFTWRQEFAQHVTEAWAKGEDVWLSVRLLQSSPKSEWMWTEGDDPNIRWKELPEFFEIFEIGERTAGADGFVQLARSERNQQQLAKIASPLVTPPQ